EQCNTELENIESEIESVLAKITEINLEIEQSRSGVAAFEEEAVRKEGEIQVLNATLDHNNETIERLKNDISAADDTGLSIDEQIAAKHAFIEENDAKSQAKHIELQAVTNELNKIISDNDDISGQSSQLTKELADLTLKLSDCKVKCSQAVSSIEEIKSRLSAIDETVQSVDKEIETASAQKQETEDNITFIKERIAEYENSMDGYRLKLKNKTEKAEKIKADYDKLVRSLEEKQSKARMLSDLEKNMEGFAGSVKAVMRQSASKALSGINGTLAQLISVDNDYSTAVEVALGAAMQNIVVDNEADAKRAINYLKQNNQGRATFLPVSAIKPRYIDEKNLDDNFGFVDIAANLVDCDAKYKNIVSNLLGRVMIVEDIDCAIGISKRYNNKYKIVTLDGQVMNPGGSMTGGSRSRGAGILSRANMIDELNAEAEKIKAQVDEIAQSYKKAMEEANLAAADVQGADADLRNAKEELIRAEGDDKLASDKLKSLGDRKAALISEKENADGRIMLFEEADKKASRESDAVQNQINDVEAKLGEISNGVDELTQKRETVRKRSEEINLELVTLAKDTEAAKLAVDELELRKSTQSDRVKSITDEIEQYEAKNQNLMLSISDVQSTVNELRAKAKSADDAIRDRITYRDNCEKRNVELRTEEKTKTSDREKLSAELVRLEERKNNMQKEFDDLNDMLFEQYELTRPEAEALGIVIENMAEAKKRLHEIKVAIRALGSINVGAIEEYKEVSERYEFLKEQIGDIEKSKSELQNIIEDLTSSMSEKFLTQFKKINEEFKVSFADFFGGGKGELILEEPDNCLESAIEIKIQPPGKSVQNINLFSGGEKSLAAMALLFSVLKVTPSPFCIYDEVEAALDDVNVERFAKYMRKMTDKTQFISITHRRGTMEEADVLYGVTMQEKGVSKLLELQSAELAAKMGLDV
ncbi:MAG: chromosome segregation protein SMC, partial [Eubacterium sp.]